MSGSREIGANPTELFRIQSQFCFCFTYYTCAAFNWLLLVTTEKLRIAGFFASSTFLTDLCNKRLKLSIHCVQLRTRLASLGPSFFRSKLAYLAVEKFIHSHRSRVDAMWNMQVFVRAKICRDPCKRCLRLTCVIFVQA